MKINDISGRECKLGPSSITIKNSDGKTAGLITGLISFKQLQNNKKADIYHKLREAGIWGKTGLLERVYIIDGVIYLLRNMKSFTYYDAERQTAENEFYKSVEGFGIVVLPVYLV